MIDNQLVKFKKHKNKKHINNYRKDKILCLMFDANIEQQT